MSGDDVFRGDQQISPTVSYIGSAAVADFLFINALPFPCLMIGVNQCCYLYASSGNWPNVK
jgi:hypothetical protein